MNARVLRSAKPAEPGAAAVPKMVLGDTEADVGIDVEAPRCSMRSKTANKSSPP